MPTFFPSHVFVAEGMGIHTANGICLWCQVTQKRIQRFIWKWEQIEEGKKMRWPSARAHTQMHDLGRRSPNIKLKRKTLKIHFDYFQFLCWIHIFFPLFSQNKHHTHNFLAMEFFLFVVWRVCALPLEESRLFSERTYKWKTPNRNLSRNKNVHAKFMRCDTIVIEMRTNEM